MATTIKTKNSTTAATAPTGLAQGELAVNITDKKLYVGDAVGNSIQIAGAGATNAAGGSNTQVQYNSSGALAGSSNMTFDGTTLTVNGLATTGTVTVGDASGDALTINSSAVSIPNGLNFDSNTLFIDAANNRVGVGTASPTQSLTVSGGGLNTTDGTVSLVVSQVSSVGLVGTATNHPLALYANGAERMRIDSSGNVGIGTSSPSEKLHVVGKITATSDGYTVNPAGVTLGNWSGNGYIQAPAGKNLNIWADSTDVLASFVDPNAGGQLILPYGRIEFPAVQNPSSNANTLDDYEEGTWTPTLAGSSSSGSATYSTQVGYYTKVGRLVTLSFDLVTSSAITGASGNLKITGFPFTTLTGSSIGDGGGVVTYCSALASNINQPVIYLDGSATSGNFVYMGSGAATAMSYPSYTVAASGCRFAGTIQYITAT